MRKTLTVLVVLAGLVGLAYFVRVQGAAERAETTARSLFVPVIVTPSVQAAAGQVLLYKATNVSEDPVNMRLMLFNDRGGRPAAYTDFMKIAPGSTVTHVHEPPTERLTLGSVTVDAAEPVRAVFAPVPGDPPGAVRRIVAIAHIMRTRSTGANGAHVLDDPILVPLERCNFEPRGFVPYTGMQWYWNCAPDMFPLDSAWRAPGMGR